MSQILTEQLVAALATRYTAQDLAGVVRTLREVERDRQYVDAITTRNAEPVVQPTPPAPRDQGGHDGAGFFGGLLGGIGDIVTGNPIGGAIKIVKTVGEEIV
jgi:ethanolamine ammonia-lyase large subunit